MTTEIDPEREREIVEEYERTDGDPQAFAAIQAKYGLDFAELQRIIQQHRQQTQAEAAAAGQDDFEDVAADDDDDGDDEFEDTPPGVA